MLCLLVVVSLFPSVLSIGSLQSYGVEGKIYCENKPASGVVSKLVCVSNLVKNNKVEFNPLFFRE